MNKQRKKEMKEKMMMQLHEQYAVNNNANISSVIVLIVGMIAVFGAYGYVFLHSTLEFSKDYIFYSYKEDLFYMDAVLLAGGAVLVVLGIIYYICLVQGLKQRKEQVVIYNIRKKFHFKNGDNILLKSWTPYGKKGFEIIQGLFGELMKICILLATLLVVSIIFRLCSPISLCVKSVEIIIFIIFLLMAGGLLCYLTRKDFKKYYLMDEKYDPLK